MRRPRIHVDLPLGAGMHVALPAPIRERLLSVLRLRDGAPVVLFDGSGCDWPGLLRVSRAAASVELGAAIAADNESPLAVTLGQAIARGEKMDLILQKATELGVSRIVPVVTERTEVRLDAERAAKRIEHWRRVVISACEQSGRSRLPTVEEPVDLAAFADSTARSGIRRFALDPEGGAGFAGLNRGQPLALVVGPEGGFGERDRMALAAAGFEGVRLGPRVLRTETAGLAGLAVLQVLAGDFG